MKKQIGIIMAMVAGLIFTGSAMAANTIPYNADDIPELGVGSDHALTTITDDGNNVVITLTNVRLSPVGKDTAGEDLKPATHIALFSGNMHAKGAREPFAIVPVVGGKLTFSIPNGAKKSGVPVAESIWGRGIVGNQINEKMALVQDPLDPWVIAYNDDLQQLAIWFVMYPNKPTVPARSFFGNKPVQGKHPKLAE